MSLRLRRVQLFVFEGVMDVNADTKVGDFYMSCTAGIFRIRSVMLFLFYRTRLNLKQYGKTIHQRRHYGDLETGGMSTFGHLLAQLAQRFRSPQTPLDRYGRRRLSDHYRPGRKMPVRRFVLDSRGRAVFTIRYGASLTVTVPQTSTPHC